MTDNVPTEKLSPERAMQRQNPCEIVKVSESYFIQAKKHNKTQKQIKTPHCKSLSLLTICLRFTRIKCVQNKL